jgi:hypothetical protein
VSPLAVRSPRPLVRGLRPLGRARFVSISNLAVRHLRPFSPYRGAGWRSVFVGGLRCEPSSPDRAPQAASREPREEAPFQRRSRRHAAHRGDESSASSIGAGRSSRPHCVRMAIGRASPCRGSTRLGWTRSSLASGFGVCRPAWMGQHAGHGALPASGVRRAASPDRVDDGVGDTGDLAVHACIGYCLRSSNDNSSADSANGASVRYCGTRDSSLTVV